MTDQPAAAKSRGPVIFLSAIGALIVALVVLFAAGVFSTGHQVDEDAWRAELEAQGVTFSDWPQYRDVWLDNCEDDDSDLQLFLAVALDEGTDPEEIRASIQHACPDRLVLFEEMQGPSDVDVACDTPPDQRTEEEQRLAEAMRC